MPGWVRDLPCVVIIRSLLELCSAAVTRESGSLDQVPDSGLGPGRGLPSLTVSPCVASRADADKTGNCLVFAAPMSTPWLLPAEKRSLICKSARTDSAFVRRGQRLSTGHIRVGHPAPPPRPRALQPSPHPGRARPGAGPELSLPIFLLLCAFGVTADAWDVTV